MESLSEVVSIDKVIAKMNISNNMFECWVLCECFREIFKNLALQKDIDNYNILN